uniref:Type II/IV secretion system protein n=1 Tax=Thermus caliditerrae TaxID=1330700 RepID=A0A7C5VJS4_9DEIN
MDETVLHSSSLERAKQLLHARGFRIAETASSIEDLLKEVGPRVLAEVLAEAMELPLIDPEAEPADPQVAHMLPTVLLLSGEVLPHHLNPATGSVVILVSDPTNTRLINHIRTTLRRPLDVAVAPADKLRSAALKAAERRTNLSVEDVVPTSTGSRREETQDQVLSDAELTGTAALVNRLIDTAISQGATDIHFEWVRKQEARVRVRVDGKLFELEKIPPERMPGVINVIKVKSALDISQHFVPQDGSFLFTSMDGKIRNEIRVSIVPTVLGEEAVLRVLPKEGHVPRLEDLGFSLHIQEKLKQVASLANGLFLVTGPTGSGKTTTLFSLIREIMEVRNPKILSVEDPVEYKLAGVSQVEVNASVGLNFARALRAFLRQDPDVILVGEMRDQESAKIAVEAAMTGHLVLGTLHTNSAVQAALRLEEMGVERFKVADALRGILAQRLVPRLCPHCRVEDPETAELLHRRYRFRRNLKIYTKGAGCPSCGFRAYKGRIAIHELVWVDREVRVKLIEGTTSDDLMDLLREKGFRTLFEDGLEKVAQGIISLADLIYATEIETSGGQE